MRRTKIIIGIMLIAIVWLPEIGCALITPTSVAVTGGKYVYSKMKEDKAKHADTNQK